MRLERARQLTPNDTVYWNDPDNGACSRRLAIAAIDITSNVACITEPDGSVVECFVRELSFVPRLTDVQRQLLQLLAEAPGQRLHTWNLTAARYPQQWLTLDALGHPRATQAREHKVRGTRRALHALRELELVCVDGYDCWTLLPDGAEVVRVMASARQSLQAQFRELLEQGQP